MALIIALALIVALGLLATGYRLVSGLPSVSYPRAVQALQRTVDELETTYQLRLNTLQAHQELARWQRFGDGRNGAAQG